MGQKNEVRERVFAKAINCPNQTNSELSVTNVISVKDHERNDGDVIEIDAANSSSVRRNP